MTVEDLKANNPALSGNNKAHSVVFESSSIMAITESKASLRNYRELTSMHKNYVKRSERINNDHFLHITHHCI
jgi:hypothetical protein